MLLPYLENKVIAVWFSCGAASAIAAKLTLDIYGANNKVLIVNNPVIEEHADNTRFLNDVALLLGHEIIIAGNPKTPHNSAESIWKKERYMSGVKGAPCTRALKKRARYFFESHNHIDYHVLGFTVDEINRHDAFTKYERANVLPVLISQNYTKQDCYSELIKLGVSPPGIYALGFPNANCIGCVKATSPTYWNLVRKQFPNIFDARAKLSRELNAKLVTYKGQRMLLDELPENAKGNKIKSIECGIFCELPKF